jgi:hypothetical protein
MKRQVLKEDVGKSGKIIAGQTGYKKTLRGRVLYVDYFGAVAFVDNDDILHRFATNLVDDFTEEELTPISDKHKGREIYWDGGRAYYKDDNKPLKIEDKI